MQDELYPYDPTGEALTNRVSSEPIKLERSGQRAFALTGAFFRKGLKVRFKSNPTIEMVENVDYRLIYPDSKLFDEIAFPVFYIIHFFNLDNVGDWLIDYQLLGGSKISNPALIQQLITNLENDQREVYEENLIGFPLVLPPTEHLHHIANTYGYQQLVFVVDKLNAYLKNIDTDLAADFTEKFNTVFAKFLELQGLLTDIDDGVGDVDGSIRQLIASLETTVNELGDKAEKNKDDIEALSTARQEDYENLNSVFTQFKEQMTITVNQLSNKVETFQNALTQLSNSISSINEWKLTVDQRLESMASYNTQLSERINELENRISNLENSQ